MPTWSHSCPCRQWRRGRRARPVLRANRVRQDPKAPKVSPVPREKRESRATQARRENRDRQVRRVPQDPREIPDRKGLRVTPEPPVPRDLREKLVPPVRKGLKAHRDRLGKACRLSLDQRTLVKYRPSMRMELGMC